MLFSPCTMIVLLLTVHVHAHIPFSGYTQFFLNMLLPTSRTHMSWDEYHRLDTIYGWMERMSIEHPKKTKLYKIGQSVEGRDLRVLRIGTRDGRFRRRQGRNKPAIFIEGGIHAREWISPASVTYMMDQLVNNPRLLSLTDEFDFYFLPVTNPDGYEYSHTNDRLWRKNRAKNPASFGICRGVDLNRNFGYRWGSGVNVFDPRPGSPLACMDTYIGPTAFSEPETQAVRDFVLQRSGQIQAYFGFHSFGNYILYPWGSTSQRVHDWRDLEGLANVAEDAISRTAMSHRDWDSNGLNMGTYTVAQKSHREEVESTDTFESKADNGEMLSGLENTVASANQGYSVGQAPEQLYRVSGGSDDWARGGAGIKWVLLFELPGGFYGFLLPSRYIKKVGESMMSGLEAMANHIKRR